MSDQGLYLVTAKLLVIFFILTILSFNIYLILVTIRLHNLIEICTRKHLTLLSLAIGDTILALYSLIIMAMVVYGSSELYKVACDSVYLSVMYREYYINFVYGMGLIALALDILWRKGRASDHTPEKIIRAFLHGAIPWFLCILVILPVTLGDMNWRSCILGNFSVARYRSMFILSLFLPAIIAPCACVATYFMVTPRIQNSLTLPLISEIPPQFQTPEPPLNTPTAHVVGANAAPVPALWGHDEGQHDAHSKAYDKDNLNNRMNEQNQHPNASNVDEGQFRCRSNNQIPNPRSSYNLPTQYPHGESYFDNQSPVPDHYFQPETSLMSPFYFAFKSEKNCLLVTSLIYFVCIFPRVIAFCTVDEAAAGYQLHMDPSVSESLGGFEFFTLWLMLCRSMITPLFWSIHVIKLSLVSQNARNRLE